MISITKSDVIRLTRSRGGVRGERRLMATQSFGPGSSATPNRYSGSPAWNHGYSVAAMRAGLVALALLAVLAVLVLS